jgi:hypothetical protein
VRRYHRPGDDVPYIRTTVCIYGDDLIERWEAMCALAGRRPHQMASAVILDAITEGLADPAVKAMVSAVRRYRSSMHLIPGGRAADPDDHGKTVIHPRL